MRYGIWGALLFALRVVGLVNILIVYKNILNNTVTKSAVKVNKYLLMYKFELRRTHYD